MVVKLFINSKSGEWVAEPGVLEEAANEKNNCGKDHFCLIICYHDRKYAKIKKGEK